MTDGRILVITSCTGLKAGDTDPLTADDFAEGVRHVKDRHATDLRDVVVPAESLYRGQHHLRLMRGVQVARDAGVQVDVRIVSAGYGLVRGDAELAPYECTFQGMGVGQRRDWARHVDIPASVKRALAEPYSLALILLGEDYLAACQLERALVLGGPTLLFCAPSLALSVPAAGNLTIVPLGRREAQRFSCGLVSLKGEVGARVLAQVGVGVRPEARADARELLTWLDGIEPSATHGTDTDLALF